MSSLIHEKVHINRHHPRRGTRAIRNGREDALDRRYKDRPSILFYRIVCLRAGSGRFREQKRSRQNPVPGFHHQPLARIRGGNFSSSLQSQDTKQGDHGGLIEASTPQIMSKGGARPFWLRRRWASLVIHDLWILQQLRCNFRQPELCPLASASRGNRMIPFLHQKAAVIQRSTADQDFFTEEAKHWLAGQTGSKLRGDEMLETGSGRWRRRVTLLGARSGQVVQRKRGFPTTRRESTCAS